MSRTLEGGKVIRSCTPDDIAAIEEIINQGAVAYRGVIPDDCWHEPYMRRNELESELAAGVVFSGWEAENELVGVMGLQQVRDVTLIRHAYVRPLQQGRGIGGALLDELIAQAKGPVLVGTWAAAVWAIRLYEKHGFRLTSESEKDRLLDAYWNIPDRQRETSVVLVHEATARCESG